MSDDNHKAPEAGVVSKFRNISWNDIAILILSATSVLFMQDGINTILTGDGVFNHTRALLIAWAIALAIQIILVGALDRFCRHRGIGFLAVYMLCATASVGAGYSAWWETWRGAHVTENGYQEQYTAVMRVLTGMREQYGILVDKVVDLSDYSEEKAKLEAKNGMTCGPSKPGPGERYNLRQNDKEVFGPYRKQFEERRQKLNELVLSAASLTSVKAAGVSGAASKLNAIVNEASAFTGDQLLAELKQRAEARAQQGRGEIVNERTGKRFTCHDPVLEGRLTDVARAAVLPPLPVVEFGNATDPKIGLQMAWSRLGNLLGSGHGASFEDLFPLIPGAFIDVLIFFAAAVRQRAPRVSDRLDTLSPLDRPAKLDHPALWRRIDAALSNFDYRLWRLLRRHTVRIGRRSYAALPAYPSSADHESLQDFVDVLIALRAAKQVWTLQPPTFIWLRLWWHLGSERLRKLDEGQHFRVYRVDERFMRELLIDAVRAEPPPTYSDQPSAGTTGNETDGPYRQAA